VSALLELRVVTVRFGERTALDHVSLSLRRGEMLALVGPNGAGKSTALRVAAGLLRPDAGEVALEGVALRHWKPRKLACALALVSQFPVLPPLYSVRDAVALGRAPHLPFLGTEGARDRAVVAGSLAAAGISGFAGRRVGELSGGERQRVAIARALAQEPRCLLMDEPTANLDLRYQEGTLSLLREMAARQGIGVLVVLHDLSVAAHFCDRVILIAEGRTVAAGNPACVLRPDLLSAVYGTRLEVIEHPGTGRPVVVHAGARRPL
jgi:iron complex transport system ATP-binding protein